MGTVQGLDTLLECARICRGELPNVQFIMIGGGVDKPRLQQRSKAMGLNNVTFLTAPTDGSNGGNFSMADVLLVHLKMIRCFRITIPSKTQAYLYMGKPIIMAVREMRLKLVRKQGGALSASRTIPEPGATVDTLYEMSRSNVERWAKPGIVTIWKTYLCTKGVKKFEPNHILLLLEGAYRHAYDQEGF